MSTTVAPIAAASQSSPGEAEAVPVRIQDLPKEVGAMLLAVGTLGSVLPGVVGGPALIAGGLVLWPRTFAPIERWFEHRFPGVHRISMQQIGRYLDDLKRRYPTLDLKHP